MIGEEAVKDGLKTDYVRNLNCNYARISLEEKPKESRYQYCILNRGGIRFLLPCSLRYIDGEAFLYYDISSTQNIAQLFEGKCIGRDWMRDFLWGMERMRQELGRYLLDDHNVIWSPQQIYQDMEKNDFYFMYVPYCRSDTGLRQLLDFWVEHVDYEDEALVEFVYSLHEQYAAAGDACFQSPVIEHFKEVEKKEKRRQSVPETEYAGEMGPAQAAAEEPIFAQNPAELPEAGSQERHKGILSLLGGRRKKQDPLSYQDALQRQVSLCTQAVAEEASYGIEKRDEEYGEEFEEEYGRTVYMEERQKERTRGLYRENGELAVRIDRLPFVVGKRKEEVDYVLEDCTVSRIHARILEEKGCLYLEDLNSTNGTFKNGLRLQPYEKRRLEKRDELRFGKAEYIFQ